MNKGYCFRCKKERDMEDTSESKLSNGRKIIKGRCKICQCRVTKFL